MTVPGDRPVALVQSVDKGWARLTWDYDSKGKLRQRCYFVPDGKGGCALQRRADAADHTLEQAYFTPEGRPSLDKDGNSHRWTARYDERGNCIETACFGLDDKPCLHKDSVHRWTDRRRGRRQGVPRLNAHSGAPRPPQTPAASS